MASQGWISVHRKLIQKPIWLNSTPEQKTILITLLLMANHEENEWEWKGQKYIVKPGQMITSLNSIVEKCGKGITTQNVRTALVRFEKLNFLTNESTKQNRLITIVNYQKYQGIENEPNKESNNQLTNDQQRPNNQLTTNNNDNNDNNDNKEIEIYILNILEQTINKKISQSSVKKLIKNYGADNVKLLVEKINESTWLKENIKNGNINIDRMSKKFFNLILEDEYKDYEKKEEAKNDYDWYKPLDL